MGRGVSKVLGGVARSLGGLFGKNKQGHREKGKGLSHVSGLHRKHGVGGRRRELERRFNRIRSRKIFKEQTNEKEKTR